MRLLDLVAAPAELKKDRVVWPDNTETEHGEESEEKGRRKDVRPSLKPATRILADSRRVPRREPGSEFDPEMV